MTYHSVFSDEEQWAYLCSKKLNVSNYINQAAGCGSNDRIVRKIFDYCSENKKTLNDTLFLIQLTWPFRFEEKNPYFDQFIRFNPDSIVHDNEVETESKEYLRLRKFFLSRKLQTVRFIQQVSSMVSIFNFFKVPHFYFIPAVCPDDFRKYADVEDFLNFTGNWIDTDYRTSYLGDVPFEKVSEFDAHPSKLGNMQIADWVYSKLQKKYEFLI